MNKLSEIEGASYRVLSEVSTNKVHLNGKADEIWASLKAILENDQGTAKQWVIRTRKRLHACLKKLTAENPDILKCIYVDEIEDKQAVTTIKLITGINELLRLSEDVKGLQNLPKDAEGRDPLSVTTIALRKMIKDFLNNVKPAHLEETSSCMEINVIYEDTSLPPNQSKIRSA